jgi:LPS-assembly protein
LLLSAVLCLGQVSLAMAEEAWQYCGTPPSPAPVLLPAAGEAMQFSADSAQVEGDRYQLQGNVVGGRGDQQLHSDRLLYDAGNDRAQATGTVRYWRGNRLLTGESASLSLGADTGQVDQAHFWLTDKHIRGQAAVIELLGPQLSQLSEVEFTTCDDGNEDWLLRASSLRLDTEANEGIARHARVSFMHVPIFYFPYLSFPLSGRKSGFLVPSVAESTSSGTELALPWYWNIAPERDATITPRYMSRRGILMEGEFRYLTASSHGQINLGQLDHDRVADDRRSALHVQHQGQPAPGWHSTVDYQRVSDGDYLDDFGGDLAVTSLTHLERRGEVGYRGDDWQANLLLQGFQTLDPSVAASARPYERLPQLTIASREFAGPAGLQLGMQFEGVQFEREAGVTGSRLDLQPHISWPWRGAAGFLLPRLGLRHTQYALQDNAAGSDATPSRTLPIFSVDSGLVFERSVGSRGLVQTLEPRLFYLYVPRREQQDLILDQSASARVFDSSLPQFGFSQLFRENRFTGGDRVGDANQVSAAVTSRFLDAKGRELLSASAGRIFYFQDREVTLPGAAVETSTASNWVAELKSQWTPYTRLSSSLEWDSEQSEWARGSLDWRYQKDARRVVRWAYRFERDNLKQFDVAGMWPIAQRWHLVGRWLRSVKDQLTLETLKGVEYESCCWAVRLVRRRYRVDAADETVSDAIWLQLELKGLTSVGRKVENLLARDILAP